MTTFNDFELTRTGLKTYKGNGTDFTLEERYGKYYLNDLQIRRRQQDEILNMNITKDNKELEIIIDDNNFYNNHIVLENGIIIENWNHIIYMNGTDFVVYGKGNVRITLKKETAIKLYKVSKRQDQIKEKIRKELETKEEQRSISTIASELYKEMITNGAIRSSKTWGQAMKTAWNSIK